MANTKSNTTSRGKAKLDNSVETAPKTARAVKKDIPLNTMVACTNLTPGKLVYISKKQLGYQITWDEPGDVDYLELSELVSMRNGQRDFFEKNWIGIDDPDIVEYLNIGQYYSNALDYEDINAFVDLSIDEMKQKLQYMPLGTKETLKVKIMQMLANDEIDSLKKINFLKESLGITSDK
jgi:hypothetical protein